MIEWKAEQKRSNLRRILENDYFLTSIFANCISHSNLGRPISLLGRSICWDF